MTWQQCVQIVKPHVVRLTTPNGHGTGFLVLRRNGRVAVATAGHVVAHAHEWGLPIKIGGIASPPISVQAGDRVRNLVHPARHLSDDWDGDVEFGYTNAKAAYTLLKRHLAQSLMDPDRVRDQ